MTIHKNLLSENFVDSTGNFFSRSRVEQHRSMGFGICGCGASIQPCRCLAQVRAEPKTTGLASVAWP